MLADLWDWVAGVFGHINDVSPYWLLAAIALKTAESALIGVTWRNILRAAYPRSGLTFKTSWGASQGGNAINAVTPAQAGTAAMIGIFRTSIPGSTVAGITSATIIQTLFFTALSVLALIGLAIARPRSVSKGSPSDEAGGFVTEHPFLTALGVLAAIVVAVVLWRRMKPRLIDLWHKAKAGGAILRDWRRYALEVAVPSALSYLCRIGVNVIFMAAFSIPITAFTVLLVAASHMLSGLFAITPGGVGQTQALDVATLRGHASSSDIAAFSITQDAIMTVWNVLLGIIVMLWAFGFTAAKNLIFKKKEEPAEAPALAE